MVYAPVGGKCGECGSKLKALKHGHYDPDTPPLIDCDLIPKSQSDGGIIPFHPPTGMTRGPSTQRHYTFYNNAKHRWECWCDFYTTDGRLAGQHDLLDTTASGWKSEESGTFRVDPDVAGCPVAPKP